MHNTGLAAVLVPPWAQRGCSTTTPMPAALHGGGPIGIFGRLRLSLHSSICRVGLVFLSPLPVLENVSHVRLQLSCVGGIAFRMALSCATRAVSCRNMAASIFCVT